MKSEAHLLRWLRRLALILSVGAAILQLRSAHAETAAGVQAGLHWEGDAAHAPDAASQSSDQRSDARLHLALLGHPGDFDTVTLAGDLAVSRYARHPGLDSVQFARHLVYTRRTGLGPGHPWWSADLGAERAWYRDDLRSGWRFSVEVGAGMRLDARWDVTAAVRAERRTQDHALADGPALPGTVFAQGHQGVRLDSRWVAAPEWTLQLAGQWLRGDFDGVHQQDLDSYAGVSAYAADPSFGPDGYGYRFRGINRTLALLASRALGSHASLSLAFSHSTTVSNQGPQYADPEVSLVYAWRS